MTIESLKVLIEDNVAYLTLNRPKRKNALDNGLFKALGSAFVEARDNDKVSVVLLAGAGGNFCSGMDLAGDFSEGNAPFEQCAEAIASFDKPIVVAVDGTAIGGGATIPLHCDVVYAGESLRMRFPFVNLGLVPEFSSSYMLQANIGARRAAEIMYTAEWIGAQRALDLGIVTAVYPDAELHAKAKEKALEIAQWPRNALVATKRCLKATHIGNIEIAKKIEVELMMKQVGSAESTEAITAFFEKRAPDFNGM